MRLPESTRFTRSASGVGLALLVVGCGDRHDRHSAPSDGSNEQRASATASSSTDAAASASSAPPDERALARSASAEERERICAMIVRRARPECVEDRGVEKTLLAMCTAHPIWDCPAVLAEEVERCWVPARVERPEQPACQAFHDKLGSCKLDEALRRKCPGYVERVSDGSPAARAGVRSGDRIVSVDDKPFSSLDSLSGIVTASEGRAVRLHVERQGAPGSDITVTPHKDRDGIYRIGVVPGYSPDCPFSPTSDVLRCKLR